MKIGQMVSDFFENDRSLNIYKRKRRYVVALFLFFDMIMKNLFKGANQLWEKF